MKKGLLALVLSLFNASGYALSNQRDISGIKPDVARCELSNGIKTILDYSHLTRSDGKPNPLGGLMDFFTSSNIITTDGAIIPFGIYKVSTVHDADKWTLVMQQVADNGITPLTSSSPLLLRLPMSVKKALSSANPVISLQTVGKTCALSINWQKSEASIGFAENAQDLSVR